MNLINIENLTKSYTERKLFNGASFSLQEGEKVGVIGINGTGKTTLLKMIMGEEETDEGTVTLANHVVLRYLPQHSQHHKSPQHQRSIPEKQIFCISDHHQLVLHIQR